MNEAIALKATMFRSGGRWYLSLEGPGWAIGDLRRELSESPRQALVETGSGYSSDTDLHSLQLGQVERGLQQPDAPPEAEPERDWFALWLDLCERASNRLTTEKFQQWMFMVGPAGPDAERVKRGQIALEWFDRWPPLRISMRPPDPGSKGW